MPRQAVIVLTVDLLIVLGMIYSAFGEQNAPEAAAKKGGEKAPVRPPLFFREEWKNAAGAGEQAITPDGSANPNPGLKLYGGKEITLSGAAGDENDPLHPWSGLCETLCAVALRDRNNYVDLTGLAKIRWNTKVSGFHKVHRIVKTDEFSIADVRWLRLEIEKVVGNGDFVEKQDVSKVDEVGFTYLLWAADTDLANGRMSPERGLQQTSEARQRWGRAIDFPA
jgi:hypothetical protein